MDLRKQSASAVTWAAIESWGTQAVSFLVFLMLARLVEPEAWGLVALASVFVAFVQIFVDSGFAEAIVQRADLEAEHLDAAFWIGLSIGCALTVGSLAVAGPVAEIFGEPRLAPIIRLLSLSFLFVSLGSVHRAILRRRLAYKSLAGRSFAASLAAGVVGVSLAYLGFGVWSLAIKILVNSLVAALVLWRVSEWRPKLRFSTRHFRDLFRFGINIVGSRFVDFFTRRSDDFLIGYFLGPVALGYYVVAYEVLLVMTNLLTSVPSKVAFPAFSRLQNAPAKMRRSFYLTTRLTSLIAFPAFMGILVIAPEVVQALYGPMWAPSAPVIQILALVGALHSVQYLHGSLVKAAGKPSWRFGIMLLLAIGSLVGFAIAVRWGIVAVAAAFVVVSYLVFPLYILAIRSLIRVDLKTYLRLYAAPMAGSIAMVVVVSGLKHVLGGAVGLYLQLFIYVVVGALVYLLAIHLTARSLIRQAVELIPLALPRLGLRNA